MRHSFTCTRGASRECLLLLAVLCEFPVASARGQADPAPNSCSWGPPVVQGMFYDYGQSRIVYHGVLPWSGNGPCGTYFQGSSTFSGVIAVSNPTCFPQTLTLTQTVFQGSVCAFCGDPPHWTNWRCCENTTSDGTFTREFTVPAVGRGNHGLGVEYPSPGGCPSLVLRGQAFEPGYEVRAFGRVSYNNPYEWHPFSLHVVGTGVDSITNSGCLASSCNSMRYIAEVVEYCGGSPVSRGFIGGGGAGRFADCRMPERVRVPHSTSAVMGVRGVLPTVTSIVRGLPGDGWLARWVFTPEDGGESETVTDGPRVGGSVISGSESPVLNIKGFTELDAGSYVMLVVPPGGTVADATIADWVTVMDDVGQPEIVTDLQPAELCGSDEATLTVEASGPALVQYRWFIDGLEVMDGSWERDGLSMYLQGSLGPQLHIADIAGAGGTAGRTFHVQCEVFNDNGSTFSFVVPVRPGPRCEMEVDEDKRVLSVTTMTADQPADFSIALDRSHDLGLTWLPGTTPIRQAAFQRVVTEIPLAAPDECASDVALRASCTSSCGVLASIDQSMIARAALSPCGPAGIDPSDFWCGSCPAQVAFAQSDFGTSDPYFVVRRAVPSSDWGVRWMFFAASSDAFEWLPVTDGPTGRGSSVASGATTPELRIDAPSGLDAGTYAMIVTPPPTVCPYEFCAAQVWVERRESIPPSCPRLVSNPASRTVCPDESDFTLSASFSVPGVPIDWYLDGYLRLEGDAGNIEVDNGPGDRVAFAFSGGTSGSVTILGYEAEGAHTLEAAPSTNCNPEGSLPAVLWPPASANRCGGCRPDLNGDQAVDGIDLGVLLAAWGPSSASADLNADGAVDGIDLGVLLAAWGACP